MKFSTLITSLLFGGSIASATTFSERREAALERRNARRSGNAKKTQIKGRSHPLISNPDGSSQNWAGSYYTLADDAFSGAFGTFNVPKVSVPAGGKKSTLYGGRAFVGIDGAGNCSVFGSAGVQWILQNGKTTYQAFYQAYPGPTYLLPNVTASPGDQIEVSFGILNDRQILAFSVENQSQNQSTETMVFGHDAAFCGGDVQWAIEDFQVNSAFVPFAAFEPVVFTDAYGFGQSVVSGGEQAQDGKFVALKQNKVTKASCSKKLNSQKKAVGIQCNYKQ